MFPKSMIATITGIGGMAGGVGSFCIQLGAGRLFDFAEQSNMTFMGYTGIEAGYMIAFSFCAVAYLISWMAMKAFVPQYKPIKL
jgi:ACS family hexuronate transporter-like MFS transporter